MEQTFKRDFGALDEIFALVARFVGDNQIDEAVTFSINLAVEEIFTNMVKYNTGTQEDISIRIDRGRGSVTLELVDRDVDPFDPESAEGQPTDRPIEERKPGGLGLHLVKSVVDKVAYEYADRQMKVTVVKNLER